MRIIVIAAGALLATAAASASAAVYRDQAWYQGDEPAPLGSNTECWNPHARHYEQVRPAERQDDLDFSRCRMIGSGAYYEAPRYYEAPPARYSYYDAPAAAGDECWNPHAGHFEQVRPGEVQNDLDFTRCRPAGYRYAYRYR